MGILNFFQNLISRIPRRRSGINAFSGFAPWNKSAYEQDTVRAIIDCIASHAAKAEAMHVVLDDKDRVREIKRDSVYARLLNQRPNDIMTGYDLRYKMITQLEDKNTALCYIDWGNDKSGNVIPSQLIPINYSDFDFFEVEGGGYAVEMTDYTGATRITNIENIVVLRKFFNNYDVGGDSNEPIYQCLDMAKASDEGLINALSINNRVSGVLEQKNSMLTGKDRIAEALAFDERYRAAAENGGVLVTDASEKYTPLNYTYATSAAQMREIRDNIMRYYRVSNEIVTSNYNESQWRAFYESVIEPILTQMGQAFTNAYFTPEERALGHRIIFNSAALINASMQTKIQLVTAAYQVGLFTVNEYRAMFGYHPVEDGDERLVSLNYVKSEDQTVYQTGEEGEVNDIG